MLDELSTNLFPPLTGAVFAKVFVREQERKKLRRRGRRGGKECAKGGKEEREGEGEREKKWRRIRLDYGPYSFNYRRVLWGNETKRFPFNCTLRPVHSTIVLSKNLITGAYGRYPRSATPSLLCFTRRCCNYA